MPGMRYCGLHLFIDQLVNEWYHVGMCPKTKIQNQHIREASHAHLLKAALKLFAKWGYHATSMNDIAKQAKVSKGLAYHYFENKEAILVALADERLKQWTSLVARMELISDPAERLIFLVEYVLSELEAKTAELRFFNSLYLTQDGVQAIAKAMEKYKPQLDRLFFQEHKLFTELGYKNPGLEATFFRSTLQGISLEYILGPKDYPLNQIKNALINKYIERGNT